MWWNDSTSLACPRCNRRSGVVVEWLPTEGRDGSAHCRNCQESFDFREAPGPETTDVSALECPSCGCNDVEVVVWPGEGGWWHKQGGKAKCNHCQKTFPIRYEENQP